ncbi:DUF4913 domain-containing protein, partial [Glutamicibacter bergerei]
MIGLPPDDDTTLDLDGEALEPEQSPATGPEEAAEEERPFLYQDAEQWLHGYALPRYLRKLGPSGHAWAPNWYEYPEVYSLVSALRKFSSQVRPLSLRPASFLHLPA